MGWTFFPSHPSRGDCALSPVNAGGAATAATGFLPLFCTDPRHLPGNPFSTLADVTRNSISLRFGLTKILKNTNKTAHFAPKTNLVARCVCYINKMCMSSLWPCLHWSVRGSLRCFLWEKGYVPFCLWRAFMDECCRCRCRTWPY